MNNKRSTMITYTDGKAIEHLHYLPYGETQVDQRATSYAARYTFSAKEKDEETGYSYFGARYYNSDLSVWLSVDPMSDKYPNTSPYVYCADNPVKLVDPDGKEVIITGADADEYVNGLQTENLKFSRTDDGILHYEGTAVTQTEKTMVAAIENKNITINICAENTNEIDKIGGIGGRTEGGSFLGTVYENGRVNTYQQVNPEKLKQIGNDIGVGRGMYERHELTEGFEAGLISLDYMFSSPPAGYDFSIYEAAHNKASFAYDLIKYSFNLIIPSFDKFGHPNFFKLKTVKLNNYAIDYYEN